MAFWGCLAPGFETLRVNILGRSKIFSLSWACFSAQFWARLKIRPELSLFLICFKKCWARPKIEPKKLGSTLSFLAQLRAGPKIEPKGPNFGPKIGSTLSLSTQIWARPKFEPIYLKYLLLLLNLFLSCQLLTYGHHFWLRILEISTAWIYCEV